MLKEKGGNDRGGIGKTSRLPSYLMYPRFLLESELNDSARLVYLLLLDRARMSMENPGWEDEQGHVFVIYTIENLASCAHRSQTVIKKALRDLQKQGLIRRQHRGLGQANRIYVRIPQAENRPPDRRNSDRQTGGKPTANQNNKNQNNLTRNYAYEGEDSL